MRSLLLVFAIFVAAANAEINKVRTRPDFDSLYARVSDSAYVVRAKCVGYEGVRRRVRLPPKRVGDAWEVDARNLEFGQLFTAEVEEVICGQTDFGKDSTNAVAAPVLPKSPIFVFVPPGEPLQTQSKFNSFLHNSRERLWQGRDYLLFLYELPWQDLLLRNYDLASGVTYYRTVEGERGAVALPDAEHPEKARDFITPLVEAVTTFCEAVKAPDAATKIRQLQAIRDYSKDPAWQKSVDQAIYDFQNPAPRRPQP